MGTLDWPLARVYVSLLHPYTVGGRLLVWMRVIGLVAQLIRLGAITGKELIVVPA